MSLTNAQAVYVKGEKPVYQFKTNGTDRIKTAYTKYNSFSSTWEMMVSLRYIF